MYKKVGYHVQESAASTTEAMAMAYTTGKLSFRFASFPHPVNKLVLDSIHLSLSSYLFLDGEVDLFRLFACLKLEGGISTI